MTRVVVAGGGISGLSAAWYLAKAGIPSTLIEPQPRLGGVVTTATVEGCVIEGGPDSFLAAKPAAKELVTELGLASSLISSNDSRRVTYIRKAGRLAPLPDGLMMMVPTKVWPVAMSPLLSWPTKIRMGLEYFRRPPTGELPERTVGDFVRDHYGQEAVDYLAEPLLSGVYGGNPDELSVSSVLPRFVELESKYGSLTRGVLAGAKSSGQGALFQTLKGGLGEIVEALETQLAGKFRVIHASAETLQPVGPGQYRVRAGGEWLEADHVVLAGPAYVAADLVAALNPALAEELGSIEYSSSMTVALGYDRASVRHPLNGFGFLVPRRERRRLVACTWVGTKFEHRVPENLALLRCFLGGTGDKAILTESDERVTALVREEIRDIMGVDAEPRFVRISRWPRSMAQYKVGHARKVERIEGLLSTHRGIHLAGNAYYGIGIPDCVRLGKLAAERIARASAGVAAGD